MVINLTWTDAITIKGFYCIYCQYVHFHIISYVKYILNCFGSIKMCFLLHLHFPKYLWDSAHVGLVVTSCVFCSFSPLRGNTPETRGTAYVVYEDIFDAKNACDHLSGFNVCNRYLVVLYYNANRVCMTITVSVGNRGMCFSKMCNKNLGLEHISSGNYSKFNWVFSVLICRLSRRWTQRRKRNS